MLKNIILRRNTAAFSGGGMYASLSEVWLDDTVLHKNLARHGGGGLTLDSSMLNVQRAFIYENDGANTGNSSVNATSANDLSCTGSSMVTQERSELHYFAEDWSSGLAELDVCSCCSGCNQAVPPLAVTQATMVSHRMVLQGSFLSFGKDSVSTEVFIGGEECVLEEILSYRLRCKPANEFWATATGTSLVVQRSDGQIAQRALDRRTSKYSTMTNISVELDFALANVTILAQWSAEVQQQLAATVGAIHLAELGLELFEELERRAPAAAPAACEQGGKC